MEAIVQKLTAGELLGLECCIRKLAEAPTRPVNGDAAMKMGIYALFKEASNLLSDNPPKALSQDHAEQVTRIIDAACNYSRRTSIDDTATCVKLTKVLYHTLCSYLRLRFTPQAVTLSAFILEVAEGLLPRAENTAEIKNILKNLYLLLWNHALDLENGEDIHNKHLVAFQCRVKALAFLFQCSVGKDKIIDQACRAVQVLEPEPSPELLLSCEEANDLVFKVAFAGSESTDFLETLMKLQKWTMRYITLLEKSNYQKLSYDFYTKLEKLTIKMTPSSTSKAIVTKCLKLSKMCCQTPICFVELPQLCQSLETLCSKAKDKELQFVLSALKLIEEIAASRRDASPASAFLSPKDMLSVECVFLLRVKLLHQERREIGNKDENALCGNFLSSAMALLQFIRFLTDSVREKTEDHLFCHIVAHCHKALGHLTELIVEDTFCTSMLSPPLYYNLGLTIGNMGIRCYNKSLYADSMPFMNAACTFLSTWCLEEEISKVERMSKVNLWNKYLLLATNYRKTGCFEQALDTLCKALALYGEVQPDFFDCWMRTKRDAALDGCDLRNRTLHTQLAKSNLKHKLNLYSLLQMELKAYKQANYYTNEETYAVITAMLQEASNDVQRAEFWIELAQVQWIRPFEHEQSPIACCNKAIDILKKCQGAKKKEAIRGVWNQFARAYFWLYMSELQQTQNNSLLKVSKSQVTPLERKLEFPKGEEVNENDICDVVPAHQHITVDAELKALETLDQALAMWKKLIETDCALVTDGPQAIQDLKASAEIYALSGEVVKEMLAWRLALTLSKHCSSTTEIVTCAARLGHLLCLTEKFGEAEATLLSCKDLLKELGESSLDVYATIKYSVTAAELNLHLKKVQLGVKYLREAWCHPYLKKKSKISYLLIADVRVVASMFLLVPYGVCESVELQPWSNSNAIGLAVAALQHLMMIAKVLCSFNEQMYEKILYSPGFSHHVVNSITNVNMILGRMYIDIGVPREARCYLKEQLAMCQRMALAIRSAEVLLLLAEVDVICDNSVDCQVKLNGVEYILEPSTENRQKVKIQKSDEDSLFCNSYSAVAIPNYLAHASMCQCLKCSNFILVDLALNMLRLQSDCLALDGELREAVHLSAYIKDAYLNKSQGQDKQSLMSNPMKLSKAFLQLASLLSSQEKNENALELLDDGIQKLKSVSYHYVDLFSLLAKLLWCKCVCLVHIAAKHCQMSPLEWLSKQLSQNCKLQSSPDLIQADMLEFHSGKSMMAVPLTPVMSRLNKGAKISFNKQLHNVSSDLGDFFTPAVAPEDELVFFPSKLATCKAPVKKWHASKLISDRNWCVEPDEVFDVGTENIPADNRRTRHCNKTRSQDSCSLLTKTPLAQKSGVPATLFKNMSSHKKASKSNVGKDSNKIPSHVIGLPGSWSSDKLSESDTDISEKGDSTTEVSAKNSVKTTRSLRKNCRIRTDSVICTRNASENVRSVDNSTVMSPVKMSMPSPPTVDVDLQPPSPTAVLMGPPMEIPRGGREKSTIRTKRSRSAKSTSTTDEVEVLRKAEVSDVAMIHDLDKRETQGENEELSTGHYMSGLESLSILQILEEAYSYVLHHPPCPLYSDLCIVLALAKGLFHSEAGFFLSEAVSSTLRHRTVHNLERKTWHASKMDCEDQLADVESNGKAEKYLDIMKLHTRLELEKNIILQRHIDSIPEGWVVCQIAAIPSAIVQVDKHHNRPLILSRYEKGKEPVIMQVPSLRAGHIPHKNLLDSFSRILEESKDSMKQEVRAKWWESRRGLDADLKVLLDDVENLWLGCAKALVLGNVCKTKSEDILKNVFMEASQLCSNLSCNMELLEVIINALPSLSPAQITEAASRLLGLDTKSTLLQTLCKILGKAALTIPQDDDRLPVILILGKEVEFLPWESIPILRSHPVSRMPSLSLLHGHMAVLQAQPNSAYHNKVDTTNTFFILNPGDDLPNTQQSFEETFTKTLQWRGIIRRLPTEEEITSALSEHDLYVYCGHGSGTKYLSGDRIQRLCCRAVSLLVGCSSARLHGFGRHLEPAGVVLQYLLAGCPSVLGCLWDVTDRDIDKFLHHLLKSWINSADMEMVLPSAVASARLACRLSYLIGCSPVVYGLPIVAQVSGNRLT